MKNSVCTAGLSHAGVPMVLLISSPSSSAKMTYSMPKFTNTPLPARKRASQASAKITGSPTRNGATRQPTSAMPIAPTTRKPSADIEHLDEIAAVEHALGRGGGVAADLRSPSAPASVREPSDAILAAAASIALRSPLASALRRLLLSASTFGCWRDSRVPLDLVERRDPARRQRRDLAVGGPAEGRHDVAQVEHLPLKRHQHGGDHQEAEHHGDPVLGAPRSRDRGRDIAGRNGADGCLIGHDVLAISEAHRKSFAISRQYRRLKKQIVSPFAQIARKNSAPGRPGRRMAGPPGQRVCAPFRPVAARRRAYPRLTFPPHDPCYR